jgi:hypothetical protein
VGTNYGPVCVNADFPKELDCVGRLLFARSPGSDVRVSFDDLPNETIERLRERVAQGEFRHDELADIPFE